MTTHLQYTPLHRLAPVLALLCLGGCADTGYLLQSAQGHMQLLGAARPIEQWLADEKTPQALKSRLQLARRIRSFAVAELGLPQNASYQSYADLQRRYAVWNVVAAPEFGLTLKTWCFPVTGCIGYRGYFEEASARALADDLRADGLEVSVYGVTAYSTLGWMNWAGGDPLLNTFLPYPDGELARIIFHELAHQVVYAVGDTMFNESFATTVERLGGARWLALKDSSAARDEYARFDRRRREFRGLCLATRARLAEIYRGPAATAAELQARSSLKAAAMQEFRAGYARLRLGWDGYSGYDGWVASANNSAFAAQAAYDELVPGFEALFASLQKHPAGQWQGFYDAVRQLAELPAPQRRDALHRITNRTETSGG